MAERDVEASDESVRQWCLKFGVTCIKGIRSRWARLIQQRKSSIASSPIEPEPYVFIDQEDLLLLTIKPRPRPWPVITDL
jgi:hypothetical protein